jgi:hypothetical protein
MRVMIKVDVQLYATQILDKPLKFCLIIVWMIDCDIMDEEKRDIDHVEKAYDGSRGDFDVHPEQDWTSEEEKAIVYELRL